ncbi:MAG: sulfatase-like hydrolase/transferase [Verrucomicrobiota bacterium]|nr:sulfatase-like hydrolase/transferase [Verrucomicrobiota bacterium]
MKVNTIYFTFFLVVVLAMSLSHFYFWKVPLSGAPLFFFLHALGQAFLEAGALLLLTALLSRWTPRWLFHCFIGFSFAILLLHFVDFTVLRLTDSSISFLFKYLFGSGVSHLITTFQALNMNGTMIGLLLLSLFAIPLLGIGFYRATQSLVSWKVSLQLVAVSLAAVGLGLLGLDLLCHPFLKAPTYAKYQKALPLGTTFWPPDSQVVALEVPFAKAREEMRVQEVLQEKQFLAASRPNIYIFVIETLRRDYLSEQTAPHLVSFAAENLSFEESAANSSSTQTSWFAIFHADFPHHWTSMQESWKRGSVPLQILKSLGYKIRVYSAADLRYYHMDELLFGKGRGLIDRMEEHRSGEAYERDAKIVDLFCKDLESDEAKHGNVMLLFFDSTHSEYSLPKEFPLRFEPMAKEIDYLTVTPADIEPVKNRYRNAVAYVDSLVGQCLTVLKKQDLYAPAIVAITGDHGEEFFEEGALFHGTHLNRYQLSVPLFYKFQSNPWIPLGSSTTHMDIFPSILHYVTGRSDFEELFDGRSIFAPKRWGYRMACLQNGSKAPSEMIVYNEEREFRFRIEEPKRLEVLSGGLTDGDMLEPLLEREKR